MTNINGHRSQIGGLMRELQDLRGNRDGIWANESERAGTTGSFFERNPLALRIRTAFSAGAGTAGEIETLEKTRAEAEARWGRPVMDPEIEAALNGGALFAAQKTLTLERLGRTPAEVTESFVTASGEVDGQRIPQARIFLQRFRPIGEPTGDVVLVSPGFLETGRVSLAQIDRLNRAGVDVIAMDHQWAGHTEGKRGAIANGNSIALHTARGAAEAAAIVEKEYGGEGRVVILGESMGAGPGALGATLMHAAGRLVLDGAKMPDHVDVVLQAPYLGSTPSLVNSGLRFASKIPVVNRIPLVGTGLPHFVDTPDAEHKVSQGMVVEDIRGTLKAFGAADAFIARLKDLVNGGARPKGKVAIVHDRRDPLADPAGSRWLAGALGAQGRLVTLDGGNHGLATSDPQVGVDLVLEHLETKS